MNQKLMKRLDNRKRMRRLDSQSGIATEYIIILVLVAVSLIAIVGKFGKSLITKFTDADSTVNSKVNIQE